MEELIYGIVTALGPHRVRASTRVFALWCANAYDQLARTAPPRYSLLTSNGTVDADAVVLAGPANGAADIVRTLDAPLASVLDEVAFAPIVVACLGYDQAALARARGPLNGFGFLVPRREGPRILGALWETSIYPNRAPAGKALLRVMIGGANDREAAGLDDHSILQILRTDLARTMGLRIAPEFVRVIRHPRGIPQYTVGHTDRLTRIDALLGAHPGLFLAGNSYRGVSINACVADAAAIAARVTAYLRSLAMRGAAVIPA